MNLNNLAATLEFAQAAKEFLGLKTRASEKRGVYEHDRNAWMRGQNGSAYGAGRKWDEVVSDPSFQLATQRSYAEYADAKRKQSNAMKRMVRRYERLVSAEN